MSQPWYTTGPTGIGYTPGNVDLATQQASLDRKRQMLQAMMLQSMQDGGGTQMAGQIAIRNSALSPLAKMLQGYAGRKGMDDIDSQERDMIQRRQEQAADAVQKLMQASQPQAGTPTTITEQPGPPDEQGTPSMTVDPGKPGGFDMPGFSKAYAQAQYAGADPALLGNMLQQFNRGRLLTQMGYGNMVPGAAQGGAPTSTPGNANQGASVSIPQGGGGAPAGGGFGGVPGQAAALTISGDPALEKLGGMINEQAKPISGRAGAPMWTRDAQGNLVMGGFSPAVEKGQTVDAKGNVTTAPGFIGSATDITKAAEAAKAPYQRPVEMPVPTGGTMPQRFDQFVNGAQPAAPAPRPAAPGLTNAPGAGNGWQYTPEQKAQFDAAAQSLRAQEPAGTPDVRQPLQFGPQTTSDKSFAEAYGTDTAKQLSAVHDQAAAATTGRATVAQMRNALQGFEPGMGAEGWQKASELVAALGGSDELAKRLTGHDPAAMEEFQKLAFGNSVAQLRALLGSGQRITQLEMLTNYKQSPNPSLRRSANEMMLQMQDGVYRWQQDKETALDDWVGKGKDPRGFQGWWNRNQPLTGKDSSGQPYIPTLEQVRAGIAAGGRPAAPKGEVPQQQVTRTLNGKTYVNVDGKWYEQ